MEKKIEDEFKLCKIFIEARHEKNLDLTENVHSLNTIAKLHKKEFQQHNLDLTNNIFMLINPVKKYNCTVDPNRVIFDYDDPNSINSFRVLVSNILKEVFKILKIDKFTRIGLRSLWGINYEDLNQINSIYKNKFFKFTNDQIEFFGENADNFHFGFNTTMGNYKINYNFAPASFQSINVHNNIVKQNDIKHYALIDIDIYIENEISVFEFGKFLNDSTTESEIRSKLFLKLI